MNQDLSGHWRGVYSYPGEVEVVPFEAWMTEAAGKISGETSEPGLHGEAVGTAYALLTGSRSGAQVRFTKVYDALDYEPIQYQGDLDGSGDEIHGRWTINGSISGSFAMKRSAPAAAEEEKEAEEAL